MTDSRLQIKDDNGSQAVFGSSIGFVLSEGNHEGWAHEGIGFVLSEGIHQRCLYGAWRSGREEIQEMGRGRGFGGMRKGPRLRFAKARTRPFRGLALAGQVFLRSLGGRLVVLQGREVEEARCTWRSAAWRASPTGLVSGWPGMPRGHDGGCKLDAKQVG